MHAVIKATFSDWRTVKGRGVLQLICEVPVEDTKRVLDTLGAPVPGSDIWVAVARLVEPKTDNGGGSAKPPVDAGGEDASVPAQPAAPARKRWHELSRAQRAGMRCAEPDFQRWLAGTYGYLWITCANDGTPDEDKAAAFVRNWCRDLRRHFDQNDAAGKRWDALEASFLQATGRMAVD